jgi:metallo-beta-lactamase family protein
VTGSCHLFECAGLRILVDCGLYQGGRELEEENAQPFGFDASRIDLLLLTHAHLDHCGRLPLLVKRGFRGEIVATPATRDLAEIVLLDSAHLQEEEAEHRHRRTRHRDEPPPEPLYGSSDATSTLERFGRTAGYGVPIRLGDGVTARFTDAGHILGSASVVLDVREGATVRRIVFSGDVGSSGHPFVADPAPPPEADYVVMETTYGDRDHRGLAESVEELWAAVAETLARGGNVIIPTFALERAQEILFFLRQGIERGRLPSWLPVYLDSPMAISATEIMRRHPECYGNEARRVLAGGADPFAQPGLRLLRDASESIALARMVGGAVILAGSGMCTGGRVRHHLQHNLWRQQSSVVFVGYAGRGTLARRIIDGADTVEIFGEPVKVRARVYTINGFSAHAGQRDLLAWLAPTGRPRTTFLVHGDPETGMTAMAGLLEARGCPTVRPALGDVVELG